MAVHEWKPDKYWNTIGSHEPALVIEDGDLVTTSTVDARGWDRNGEQAAPRGNPMTGPFFVKGAEPGDTLAVRFETIIPNRGWAWAADVLASNVVDPTYIASLPKEQIKRWTIDKDNGTASPEQESGALAGLRLPLTPFFGCFGVAPPRGQAIGTATSGAYGGNMDYRGFKVGVTVYLPVFVQGALFFLGDGHALQGDGEIVGTGLEISMDTTFSISLLKGHTIEWPRGETDDSIFTVGNARPLDQALQHATTEMLRWLTAESGYHLSIQEASQLMGHCVEYEIGNVFNPAYTIVCKMKKKWLPARAG